jgi:hypothetical protein
MCYSYRDTPSPARRAHAINAGKYASSICASVASQASSQFPSPYTVTLWIICAVVSTTYNFTWFVTHTNALTNSVMRMTHVHVINEHRDIKCDWGLLVKGSRNRFLRNNLILPKHKWIYFVGMFCNLCLRVAWIVSISPAFFGTPTSIISHQIICSPMVPFM